MTESRADSRPEMVRYLLGQLSEEEAAVLETRYFEDEEAFALLEVAADDLADLYVAGRLSSEERARFERHCLGSRDDRLRLRVAKAMRTRVVPDQARTRPSFFEAFAAFFQGQTPTSRLVVTAAGVLMVAGAAALALRLTQLQRELSRVENEMTTRVATAQSAASAAAQQAADEKARRQSLERRLGDLSTVGFALVPGLDRGSATELLVARDAALVRFELAFERPLPAGRYRAALRTVDRLVVWSEEISATGAPSSLSLTLVIPASSIRSGQYEIVIQPYDATAAGSTLATYAFQIRRAS